MTLPPFRLTALGDPFLCGPAGPVQGRAAHRKRIALLAVLAVARGRPVGRERLIGLLWPEQPPEAARHNLSESLYVLRKELGEDVVAAGPAGDVALNPGVVAADVAELQEALEAGDGEGAVRLYRGPLLDGFYLPDAPGFEGWVEGERDRLARAVGRLLHAMAEEAEGAGSPLRAVGWWRRLARLDPFNTGAVLRLAAALEQAGERAEALRTARTHAAFLAQELEIEGDPALREVVERLSAPAAAEEAPSPGTGNPAPPSAPAEPAPPAAGSAGAGRLDAVPAPAGERAHPAPPAPGRAVPVRLPGWGLARLLGAAVGLVLGLFASGGSADGGVAGLRDGPEADPRRVAVLYLEDLSPGGELRPLAAAITERLIAELSHVPALEVLSRAVVEPYRHGATRFDDMVAELRVGSLVEGTVQRSGDTVWVTASMVDAGTGRRLETIEVARPLGDAVGLQRVVAGEVSAALRRRVGVELRKRAAERGGSPLAQALVRRAEQLREQAAVVARSGNEFDVQGALALLQRADSLLARAEAADRRWGRPTVTRGWIDLARGQLQRGAGVERRHASAIRRAERILASRSQVEPEALELRGTATFRQALEMRDTVRQRARLDAAERDLRAAVEGRPSLARAWSTLSQVLRIRGLLAESDMAARRALLEDAYLEDAADIRHRLFFSALSLGDYGRARYECEQGARQFAQDWRFLECRLTLLRNDLSRPAEPGAAWQLVAQLDRLDPPAAARRVRRPYSPVFRRMAAAAVSARAGDGDSARAVLARARREAAGDADAAFSLAYDEAWVLLMLGDTTGARGRVRWMAREQPVLARYLARDPLAAALGSPP